jgi:hypothetical protein
MGWGADRGGVVRGEVFEIAEKLHHGGAETRREIGGLNGAGWLFNNKQIEQLI